MQFGEYHLEGVRLSPPSVITCKSPQRHLTCVSVVASACLAASHNERDASRRRRQEGRVDRRLAASLVELQRVCRLGSGRESHKDDVMHGPGLQSGTHWLGAGRRAAARAGSPTGGPRGSSTRPRAAPRSRSPISRAGAPHCSHCSVLGEPVGSSGPRCIAASIGPGCLCAPLFPRPPFPTNLGTKRKTKVSSGATGALGTG